MPCVCGGCLLCCLFLSGLLLSFASVSFRSCEDLFDYIRLSSSWTRSSSLRDLRQDDHTLEIISIFACYLFGLSLCRDTYHLLIMPPIFPCQASNPAFLANCCLAMLPLCSAPLIALLVAGEDWSLFLVGTWIFCWDNTISII